MAFRRNVFRAIVLESYLELTSAVKLFSPIMDDGLREKARVFVRGYGQSSFSGEDTTVRGRIYLGMMP